MPRTLICVPIMVESDEDPKRAALDARALGADLVELRVDPLAEHAGPEAARSGLAAILDGIPLPCVVTCRSAAEGGAYTGGGGDLTALLDLACRHDRPPRYIDVEHATLAGDPALAAGVERLVRETGVGLILSFHDFTGRPPTLMRTIAEMRAVRHASVLKIAFRARSVRDNLEVFDLLAERDRPMIALAMGEHGLMSRVLAPKFGALLTFASLRDESATAPGQPTVAELRQTYRFASIGPATRVYGVVGHPVSQSIGPLIHNAAFEALGHDGVYLRLPVEGSWESFKATTLSLIDHPGLGFAGASVTIPHKRHLLRLAGSDGGRAWRVGGPAERSGAGNTLAVRDDGSCEVDNTDVAGVVEPLRAALGGSLSGAAVSLLGAGGAARAAAAGLLAEGARVTIMARRPEAARAMAAEVAPAGAAPAVGAWDAPPAPGTRAVVNCTPVGMAGGPAPDDAPLPPGTIEGLDAGVVVFETVYNPRDTPLLRSARDRGLRTIDGLEMFTRQAAAQLHLWTGLEPPIGLIERVSADAFAPS